MSASSRVAAIQSEAGEALRDAAILISRLGGPSALADFLDAQIVTAGAIAQHDAVTERFRRSLAEQLATAEALQEAEA